MSARRRSGLLFELEDGRGRFLVEPGTPPIIVGRRPPYEPQNIKVPSRIASREHVRVVAADGGVLIEDAMSAGGTFLDGERVAGPTPIGPGARVQLHHGCVYTTRAFEGFTLHDLITGTSGPVCSSVRSAAMADQLLRALRPLHDAAEVHGNLDWHHLVLDSDDRWTLLIDGWTVLDPDGRVSCNPMYLAPEVFSEHRLLPASDIYALGLLCFEARFGYGPFHRDDVQEHMMNKLFGGQPEWRREWPGERPTLSDERFFGSLLAGDPRHRPGIDRCLDILVGREP